MATSILLDNYYKSRNPSPSDLLDKFNPHNLHPHGYGNAGIGSGPASTGPSFTFVTRPDLNIETEQARAYFGIGKPTVPENIAKMLTGGGDKGFIKMLTNLAETYSASDLTMDITSVGENWEGAKIVMPKSSLNSRQDGNTSIEYQEWEGTPVTILHKLWFDYIEAVTRGVLNPKTDAPDYISSRQLDYAVSIYDIQCLPDGTTIEFLQRRTGCFPGALPYSVWNGKRGPSENIKVTIPYTYSFYEPMDVALFYEFNKSASGQGVEIKEAVLPQSNRKVFQLVFTEGLKLF